MKAKYVMFGLFFVLFLSVSSDALADRQLGRSEILQVFQQLTSQPKKTWLSTGTIEATHEEHAEPQTTNETEISAQISREVREYQDNPNKRQRNAQLQKMKLDAIPFNVRYKLSNQHTMKSKVVEIGRAHV